MIRPSLSLAALLVLAGCQQSPQGTAQGGAQASAMRRPGDAPTGAAQPPAPERTPSGDRPFRQGDARSNAQTAADIAKFEDPKGIERMAAARRLAAQGEVAIPQLLQALETHPGARTRGMAAYTLGNMGDRRVVDPLARALSDAATDVRLEVATALLRLGDVRGFDTLIGGLEDPDPRIRFQSIGNLKEASGSNFGFEPDGDPLERQAAVARWRGWVQQRKESAR
jgi:hypothetical protein